MNLRAVGKVLGFLLMVTAACLLLPAAVAGLYREPDWLHFLLAAGLHGLYDFIVLQQTLNALPIAAFMILVIWIWRLRLLRRLQEKAVQRGRTS